MHYYQQLSLGVFICFFLIQYSNNSSPDKSDYLRSLDKVPQRVQDLDSVSVFDGGAAPKYSVELVPEQTLGKSGKPYLTQVQDCIVDDKGSVIIQDLDNKKDYNFPNVLYAYNPDGSFRTQVGGPGRGPGEYGFILRAQAKAGKIIVFDFTNKRLNIYNTNDYTREDTILLEQFKNTDHEAASGFEFGYVQPRMDGNYLATFSESASTGGRTENKYLLMDRDGKVLDFKSHNFSSVLSIRTNSGPISAPSVPLDFMGVYIDALSSDDARYSAWSQDFLIKKYDSHGTYQSAIYYNVQGSPFDFSDYTEDAGYSQSDVMDKLDKVDEELPEANPVIADLKVDDKNRIWVAVPTGVNSDSYEWWILDESGQLLAKLVLPRDKEIYDIRDGFLYSKKTNEETDTEYVVKYRIALTEK